MQMSGNCDHHGRPKDKSRNEIRQLNGRQVSPNKHKEKMGLELYSERPVVSDIRFQEPCKPRKGYEYPEILIVNNRLRNTVLLSKTYPTVD